MRLFTRQSSRRAVLVGTLIGAALMPVTAHAQLGPQDFSQPAIGEKYWIEVAGTLWNPQLFGLISSDQLASVGSTIDFTEDLGYPRTRFSDLRVVLRPTRKSKLRVQYTPLRYTAETTFTRDIEFQGVTYPLGVPIESSFNWMVWRLGYEYDVVYKPRGFVGVLAEVRYTRAEARLATNSPAISPRYDESRADEAPLPAFGVVARAYPLPALAIDFEVSGMKVPDISPDYQGRYVEWDLRGTFNATNNVGVQLGWRTSNTYLIVQQHLGDLKFSGLWFGAVLRY